MLQAPPVSSQLMGVLFLLAVILSEDRKEGLCARRKSLWKEADPFIAFIQEAGQFKRDFNGIAGLSHWPLSKEHFGKISDHLVVLKN